MQPTVQSEQDKMVPIDTSGDPVEVEVKEDDKKVNESSESRNTTRTANRKKKEELENYSDSVKRRIDKLTRKMREAERREQAAIEYAKKVQENQKSLQAQIVQRDESIHRRNRKEIRCSRRVCKKSITSSNTGQNDPEKQVEAQQAISKMAVERQNFGKTKNANGAKEPNQSKRFNS